MNPGGYDEKQEAWNQLANQDPGWDLGCSLCRGQPWGLYLEPTCIAAGDGACADRYAFTHARSDDHITAFSDSFSLIYPFTFPGYTVCGGRLFSDGEKLLCGEHHHLGGDHHHCSRHCATDTSL
ncbi:MAG: hypothetical protein NTV14_03065 [Coprothermobacterota bacterium]|nr:hypothetical protein [Coprothermobacterota bacterium]